MAASHDTAQGPESVLATVARLRSFGKPNRGAPAYSRFVNRPIGRIIAAVAFRLGLTPNGVTLISGCLSLTGIVVLMTTTPSWPLGILVAVLLAAGYAFDSADGQLARLTGGGSPAGEWLDHVVDAGKISLLHVAVLVGLTRTGLDRHWLAVPLAYLVAANLFFFTFVLTDLLGRLARSTAPSGIPNGPLPQAPHGSVPTRAPLMRSMLTLPTDYGLLCVVFLLWGGPSVFVVVYGALMLGTAGYVLLGLPKWFGDMKRLGAAAR